MTIQALEEPEGVQITIQALKCAGLPQMTIQALNVQDYSKLMPRH